MTDIITDIAEIKNAINEGFQAGTVDHTNSAEELREFYVIGNEIDDEVILDALAEAVRDDTAPVLVLTLGTDTVQVQVDVGDEDDNETMAAAFAEATREISESWGYRVRLYPAGSTEEGNDILIGYRAPQGDYCAHDVEDVQRFGVEIGPYRVVTEDRETA